MDLNLLYHTSVALQLLYIILMFLYQPLFYVGYNNPHKRDSINSIIVSVEFVKKKFDCEGLIFTKINLSFFKLEEIRFLMKPA